MRPTFADPTVDFAFYHLFGTAGHKGLLIALLNALLELDANHRIIEVERLSREQRPPVTRLKFSTIEVKCTDVRGAQYVVDMQILNVEGFEKHVMREITKAYRTQIGGAKTPPERDDAIGISICDFEIWPAKEAPHIPMLSRWRLQTQHDGDLGQRHIQLVFLELPKLDASREPRSSVEKWAYFFRETRNLKAAPPALAEPPLREALETVRIVRFTEREWDAYIRALIALQDARGAIALARRQGFEEGLAEVRLDSRPRKP